MASPRLGRDDCREYQDIAMACVHETVAQYAAFIRPKVADRGVDPNEWKLMKSRDNIKVYKANLRRRARARASTVPVARESLQWPLSTSLLAVGSLAGTLEDAMYGTVTPTAQARSTRSLLIQDQFTQHQVLQDIKLPTARKPFNYVGLNWALQASKAASVIKPRDYVFVEASGFLDMPRRRGLERVGYRVCHSVHVPDLAPASTCGAVRGRMSMCTLFRQKARGIVDVYMTLGSDPGGSLPSHIACATAADVVIAVAGVMECALSKKLARMVHRNEQFFPKQTAVQVQGSDWNCQHCAKRVSSFRSMSLCRVCRSTVCSRCVSTRKLAPGGSVDELSVSSAQVCNGCTQRAFRQVPTAELSVEQGGFTSHQTLGKPYIKFNSTGLESYQFHDWTNPSSSEKLSGTDSYSLSECLFDLEDYNRASDGFNDMTTSSKSSRSEPHRDLDGVDKELMQTVHIRETAEARLARRMTGLCIRAEQTHAITALQSCSLHLSATRQPSHPLTTSAPNALAYQS